MGNTIIPLDSGSSYIVSSAPLKQNEAYRFVDHLNRTVEEQKFVEQFERIFYAAANGNLKECRQVVAEGFRDFNAYSVGKKPSYDHVSPLQVAKKNKHSDITRYFKQVLSDPESKGQDISKMSQQELLDILCNPQLSAFHPICTKQIMKNSREFQKNNYTTEDEIIDALTSSETDEKLLDLVERVVVDETKSCRNPLDSILNHRSKNPEAAVRAMVQKFPVNADNLEHAIAKEYSEKTISLMCQKASFPMNEHHLYRALDKKNYSSKLIKQMLEKINFPITKELLYRALIEKYDSEIIKIMFDNAVTHNKELDTERCMSLVFNKKYSEDLILQFFKLAGESKTDPRFVSDAIELKFSNKTIEFLIDTIPQLEEYILWADLFPRHLEPTELFFKKQKEEFVKQKDIEYLSYYDKALTKEFNEKYWSHFIDQPKPYIPFLHPISSSCIKKIITKCTEMKHIAFTQAIGQVNEDILSLLLEKNPNLSSFTFQYGLEKILLYGYSEQFVLAVLDRCQKGEIGNAVEIAKLRDYSPELITELKKKSSSLLCVIQ